MVIKNIENIIDISKRDVDLESDTVKVDYYKRFPKELNILYECNRGWEDIFDARDCTVDKLRLMVGESPTLTIIDGDLFYTIECQLEGNEEKREYVYTIAFAEKVETHRGIWYDVPIVMRKDVTTKEDNIGDILLVIPDVQPWINSVHLILREKLSDQE